MYLQFVYTLSIMKNELFEWDDRKNQLNFIKHGIYFDEATEIFNNPFLTIKDNRCDYGEERYISVGSIRNLVVIVVAHTDRSKRIRIISARKANKKEQSEYYAYLKEATE